MCIDWIVSAPAKIELHVNASPGPLSVYVYVVDALYVLFI